ncbi:uncharacterized protein LOC114310039 [Camellia sinensis]|uniref:uncharacterized protein LOC114310039 n=1 Tax=Camellia sinensis TaxID=4442 RepID=UPI0010362244|nr:uncharacterized protein LOC114310039 [Camellia sinensis]
MDVRKPAKDFRQSYVPSKDLKKLLDLPVHKRKAPLLLNFIPTYKSTLPDVPKKKKKSISPPSATTLPTVSTSRADQGSTSDPADLSAEAQSSESTQSKKPRSSSATTSGSKIPRVLWVPEITLEDKPVLASESAEDINVGMALSTAVLFPGDLERNAKMSEYENYAFMLQRSVQAIQHAHSLFMQAFETREKLADMRREMKKLEDQAEAATKAQQMVEEKAKSAEAIRKVAEAKKKEAELNILDDSLLRKADAIPLSFPPPPSSSQPEGKSESESEGEKEGEDEALVRKSKEAGEIKSPPQDDQVLDLTHKEDEEVIKETTPEQASSDVPPVGKSVDETLAEIDAEIAANKEAEVSLQETSQVQIQPVADAEKS